MIPSVRIALLALAAVLLAVGGPGCSRSVRPDEWKPERKRCHSYRGRRYCDGPRRVPEPHGEAAARAKQLGVGTRRAASRVLTGHVPRSWFEAAPGEPSDELLWPVEGGRFGRGFGHTRKRRRGLQHDGLDIVAEVGTPVRAAASGLVVYSDNGVQGMGNLLMLAHPNGTTTLYAHLEAAYVFAGQQVERGQTIGELGTTGLSRGPHLHFEWRDRGRPRDPAPRIVGRPRP